MWSTETVSGLIREAIVDWLDMEAGEAKVPTTVRALGLPVKVIRKEA